MGKIVPKLCQHQSRNLSKGGSSQETGHNSSCPKVILIKLSGGAWHCVLNMPKFIIYQESDKRLSIIASQV